MAEVGANPRRHSGDREYAAWHLSQSGEEAAQTSSKAMSAYLSGPSAEDIRDV